MKKICFSLLCHESNDCFLDLIQNIIYFSSNFNILILVSCTNLFYNQIKEIIKIYNNIHIVTIRDDNLSIWGNVELFNQHTLNMKYLINNNIIFDYFWYMASNELFLKHITEEHLNKYAINKNNCELKFVDGEYNNEIVNIERNKYYKYWIDEFKKDLYTYNIFKD